MTYFFNKFRRKVTLHKVSKSLALQVRNLSVKLVEWSFKLKNLQTLKKIIIILTTRHNKSIAEAQKEIHF